jgi:hypothetical protein
VPRRAVPLDERVDHAEQQPRGDGGADVGPDVAVPPGLADQAGDDAVEGAAALQGLALGPGVAAHAQQHGHVGQLGLQHRDRGADQRLEPVDRGRARGAGHGRLAHRRLQAVQRPPRGQAQQLLLPRHVVVDRRPGHPEAAGQVIHAGAVVAALVEHLRRGRQQRVQVMARPAAPALAVRHGGSVHY